MRYKLLYAILLLTAMDFPAFPQAELSQKGLAMTIRRIVMTVIGLCLPHICTMAQKNTDMIYDYDLKPLYRMAGDTVFWYISDSDSLAVNKKNTVMFRCANKNKGIEPFEFLRKTLIEKMPDCDLDYNKDVYLYVLVDKRIG